MDLFQLEKLPYGRECNCRFVYVYFGVIVLMIAAYALIMIQTVGLEALSSSDILNKNLADTYLLGPIGGWPISHLLCFFVAGLLFPNCFVLVFILGVLWEVIELIIGNIVYQLIGGRSVSLGGVIYDDRWMIGRVEDIVFDVIGFLLGKVVIDAYRDLKYGKDRVLVEIVKNDPRFRSSKINVLNTLIVLWNVYRSSRSICMTKSLSFDHI